MNEHKFAFIIATNDDLYLEECSYYIDRLIVPDGFETDVITIREAGSICEAYNAGMHSSDALYKVYLHQDVFILNRNFIQDVVDSFALDPQVAMLGVIGAKKLPSDAYAFNSWDTGGTVFYNGRDGGIRVHDNEEGLNYVSAIDGMIMITNKDIEWREDVFDGWDFYDLSQSVEFSDAGYKVAIPCQKSLWCFHDVEHLGLGKYEYYRKLFCETYGKSHGFDQVCDLRYPFEEESKKNRAAEEEIAQLIKRDLKYGRIKNAAEKISYLKYFRVLNDNNQELLKELLNIYIDELKTGSRNFWSRGTEFDEIREKYLRLRFLIYRAQFDRPSEDFIPELKEGLMSSSLSVSAIRIAIEKYIFDKTKVYERLLSEGIPVGREENRPGFLCPVCGNREKVLTFNNSNKKVRMKYVFPWLSAAYTGEGEKEIYCAACGASLYERTAALLTKTLLTGDETSAALIAYSPVMGQWLAAQKQVSEIIKTEGYITGQEEADEIKEFLTLESESCDIIITFDTFARCEDDKKTMRELKRILKKDGYLIALSNMGIGITDSIEYDPIDAEERLLHWSVFGGERNRRCYAIHDFVDRLIDSGFYVGRVDKDYLGKDVWSNLALPERFQVYVCTKTSDNIVGIQERRSVFNPRKKVSFIVLTDGRADKLGETIRDINELVYPAKEIIIAAERLTEAEKQILSDLMAANISVIEVPGGSKTKRRNAGIDESEGEYLVFAESGNRFEKNFIYYTWTLLETDQKSVLAYADTKLKEKDMGIDRFCPDPSINKLKTSGYFWRDIVRLGYPKLPSALIRRSAVDTAGKFDERLLNMGEKEFLLRIMYGNRAAEVPQVQVTVEVNRDDPFAGIEERVNELLTILSEFDLKTSDRETYKVYAHLTISELSGYEGDDRVEISKKIYERLEQDEVLTEGELKSIYTDLRLS